MPCGPRNDRKREREKQRLGKTGAVQRARKAGTRL